MNELKDELDHSENFGSGLLDFLLLVAENWRLLILGPLAVGISVFSFTSFLQQSFTSEAILALPSGTAAGAFATGQSNVSPAQAAAIIVSPVILDPVIESLKLADGLAIQLARRRLASQIRVSIGRDGLLRLDATANTPQEAQKLANTVIDAWLRSTVPGQDESADLEKRLQAAKFALDSVDRLLKRLASEGGAGLSSPLTRGEAGTSITAISELQSKFLGDVLAIPRILKGMSREVVKQAPTLPTEPSAPRKLMVASLCFVLSGFLFLLWIYFKRMWISAAGSPASADKQRRILNAFGFKN